MSIRKSLSGSRWPPRTVASTMSVWPPVASARRRRATIAAAHAHRPLGRGDGRARPRHDVGVVHRSHVALVHRDRQRRAAERRAVHRHRPGVHEAAPHRLRKDLARRVPPGKVGVLVEVRVVTAATTARSCFRSAAAVGSDAAVEEVRTAASTVKVMPCSFCAGPKSAPLNECATCATSRATTPRVASCPRTSSTSSVAWPTSALTFTRSNGGAIDAFTRCAVCSQSDAPSSSDGGATAPATGVHHRRVQLLRGV